MSERKEERQRENGAILPLAALLIGVLVLFTALAIDLTRVSSSHSQQKHTAEMVALAALESFMDTAADSSLSLSDRLTRAVTRAEEVAGLNFLVGIPGRKQVEAGDLGVVGNTSRERAERGAAGVITPGSWWFTPPDSCVGQAEPCPCSNGVSVTPCFQPYATDGASPVSTINAFHVLLHSKDTPADLIDYAFFPGAQAIQSEATAAVVPRHGMFLIDLTPTVEAETHLRLDAPLNPGEQPPFPCTRSAYRLVGPDAAGNCAPGNCCPSGADYPSRNACPAGVCKLSGVTPPGEQPQIESDHAKWNAPQWGLAGDQRNGAETTPIVHYRDDYGCYLISWRDLRTGELHEEHYLLDSYVNLSPSDPRFYYRGPEPLTSIFDAVHQALIRFLERSAQGDLVGAIGFDRTADQIDLRLFDLMTPGDPATLPDSHPFKTLYEMTDVENENSVRKRYERMFFIRRESEDFRTFTNIPAALAVAQDKLIARKHSQFVQQFIVLFSGALANCTRDENCGDIFYRHAASMTEVVDLTRELIKNRIALHIFLVGDEAMPHTYLTPSPKDPNRCLTEREARSNPSELRMLVNPILPQAGNTIIPPWDFLSLPDDDPVLLAYDVAFNNADKTDRSGNVPGFPYVNFLWIGSAVTGGVYAPIRRPCEVGVNIQAELDAACANGGSSDPQFRGIDWPFKATFGPYVVYGDTATKQYTDQFGRLLCDPQGMSRADQVRAYMDQVMGTHPYVLVEPRPTYGS